MAFDEVALPLRVSYGAQGGPEFKTEVITVQGGYERRNQVWSSARRRFDASTGVRTAKEASILVSFFQARAGRARGFRLKDWSDFTSSVHGVSAPHFSDQEIAVGDGVQTQFQLIKTYGDEAAYYKREIKKPIEGSVLISVDDVPYVTEWSVDITSGAVTFSMPPADGAVIKAGYVFDVPVRFDLDSLSVTALHQELADKIDVPLIEVRV